MKPDLNLTALKHQFARLMAAKQSDPKGLDALLAELKRITKNTGGPRPMGGA